MILDSSAIIALLLAEPGHEAIRRLIGEADVVAVGAPTLVEAALVLSSRLKRDARPLLSEFVREAEVEVIPFEHDHYDAAVDAFQRYGKGRHSPALNFGDCLTYATARVAGLPLLFSGDDFAQTDLTPAR
jgi:ribonuclease VapC